MNVIFFDEGLQGLLTFSCQLRNHPEAWSLFIHFKFSHKGEPAILPNDMHERTITTNKHRLVISGLHSLVLLLRKWFQLQFYFIYFVNYLHVLFSVSLSRLLLFIYHLSFRHTQAQFLYQYPVSVLSLSAAFISIYQRGRSDPTTWFEYALWTGFLMNSRAFMNIFTLSRCVRNQGHGPCPSQLYTSRRWMVNWEVALCPDRKWKTFLQQCRTMATHQTTCVPMPTGAAAAHKPTRRPSETFVGFIIGLTSKLKDDFRIFQHRSYFSFFVTK